MENCGNDENSLVKFPHNSWFFLGTQETESPRAPKPTPAALVTPSCPTPPTCPTPATLATPAACPTPCPTSKTVTLTLPFPMTLPLTLPLTLPISLPPGTTLVVSDPSSLVGLRTAASPAPLAAAKDAGTGVGGSGGVVPIAPKPGVKPGKPAQPTKVVTVALVKRLI